MSVEVSRPLSTCRLALQTFSSAQRRNPLNFRYPIAGKVVVRLLRKWRLSCNVRALAQKRTDIHQLFERREFFNKQAYNLGIALGEALASELCITCKKRESKWVQLAA